MVSYACAAIVVPSSHGCRSSAVEFRRAPLAERRQAFLELLCQAGEFQVEHLLVHSLREGGVLAVVNRLFGQADRDGRALDQLAEQRRGGGVEGGRIDGVVDEAPLRGV